MVLGTAPTLSSVSRRVARQDARVVHKRVHELVERVLLLQAQRRVPALRGHRDQVLRVLQLHLELVQYLRLSSIRPFVPVSDLHTSAREGRGERKDGQGGGAYLGIRAGGRGDLREVDGELLVRVAQPVFPPRMRRAA